MDSDSTCFMKGAEFKGIWHAGVDDQTQRNCGLGTGRGEFLGGTIVCCDGISAGGSSRNHTSGHIVQLSKLYAHTRITLWGWGCSSVGRNFLACTTPWTLPQRQYKLDVMVYAYNPRTHKVEVEVEDQEFRVIVG